MRMTIAAARDLVFRAMKAAEHSDEEAIIIADHLIDCELRGLHYGGIPRALSIVERICRRLVDRRPISVIRETPISIMLDGGQQVGYLTAYRATLIGIEKAKMHGIAVAGLTNSYYTGMFAYYMEMATRENLVAMAAGSSDWRVAPAGSSEGRFGTNPIAFGFPSLGEPIIFDAGMASVMISEATLTGRLGGELPEGTAYDKYGNPTRNPWAALAGALTVWGEHKGSGLATMIQLFGLLAGGTVRPDPLSDCSMFMMFMKPDLLVGEQELRTRVSAYAEEVRRAKPLDPSQPPRMPFDRSIEERRRRLADNSIEVDDSIVRQLLEFIERAI